MKKIKMLLSTVILSSIMVANSVMPVYAATNSNVNEILSLMPGTTIEELEASIKETANSLGKSEEEVSVQILSELKTQEELNKEEQKSIREAGPSARATYTLGAAKYNGDVFYEPASTAGISHGHVGIYWTANTIVESMPSSGVRSLSRTSKKVGSGAKIFTFKNITAAKQNTASNWAYARKGDSYSYNFATNRSTSAYGAKNCSKLVWSSYKETAGYDLDKDGGLGVYPKDILGHSWASVYTTY